MRSDLEYGGSTPRWIAPPGDSPRATRSRDRFFRGAAALLLTTSFSSAADPVSFTTDVAPIFQRHCVACHKEGKAKGKYRIDSYALAVKELVAGNLEESELYFRITTDDEDDRMPAETDPLAVEEIATIRTWIAEGARFDGEDPGALLASIVPMEAHPAPPAEYPRPLPVTAMAFGNQGRELFTGGYHEILVWEPVDGGLQRRIPNNGQRTYDLALSPDGSLLAAATGSPGQAGELRIFHPATGEVLATPFRSDDIALAVAFDPDGARLALGASDGKLRVFETKTWQETIAVTAHSDWINAVSWNDDGSRLATASRDKTAKVFDLAADGKRLVTFSGHAEPVRGVAFHPNGNEMISCDDHGLVLRWKIADGKKSGDLANLGGPALRLAASESEFFAAGPGGLTARFQQADQKRLPDIRLAADSPAPAVTECATHRQHLAVGTFDGQVVLFDLSSGEQLGSFVAAP